MKKILFLFAMLPLFCFAQNDTIGVYYISDSLLVKINPIKSSGYKANTLGTALTMGIASSKMVVKFRGAESKNKVNEPSFIFFFRSPVNFDMINGYFNFSGLNNPANFILARMKKTRSGRELNWGKVRTYSGIDVGVPDEDIIPFEVYEITENKYLVKPSIDLPVGEYAFIFDGINGSGAFMPVFDFTVIKTK